MLSLRPVRQSLPCINAIVPTEYCYEQWDIPCKVVCMHGRLCLTGVRDKNNLKCSTYCHAKVSTDHDCGNLSVLAEWTQIGLLGDVPINLELLDGVPRLASRSRHGQYPQRQNQSQDFLLSEAACTQYKSLGTRSSRCLPYRVIR